MDDRPITPSMEPFRSQPMHLSGCGKPVVVGCLIVLVLVALGLVALMWKARDLLEFAIGEYREVVVESLPPDLTEAERVRLEQAFENALSAIREGRLEPAGLQRLQRVIATPPRPGETLDRDEVRELTEALEQVAGTPSSLGGEVEGSVALGTPTPTRPALAAESAATS